MLLEIEGEQLTYEQFVEINANDGVTEEADFARVKELEPGKSTFIGITEVIRIS